MQAADLTFRMLLQVQGMLLGQKRTHPQVGCCELVVEPSHQSCAQHACKLGPTHAAFPRAGYPGLTAAPLAAAWTGLNVQQCHHAELPAL